MMTTSRSVVQTGKVVGKRNLEENAPEPKNGAKNSPLFAPGQSVGGALTSAKSAMSSWFSTLAQPSGVPTPAEPPAEVKP